MAELLDLKDMEKKYPSNVNFSKDEIKQIVSDLKRQDWITLPKHRAGRDGGAGNYIENDKPRPIINYAKQKLDLDFKDLLTCAPAPILKGGNKKTKKTKKKKRGGGRIKKLRAKTKRNKK